MQRLASRAPDRRPSCCSRSSRPTTGRRRGAAALRAAALSEEVDFRRAAAASARRCAVVRQEGRARTWTTSTGCPSFRSTSRSASCGGWWGTTAPTGCWLCPRCSSAWRARPRSTRRSSAATADALAHAVHVDGNSFTDIAHTAEAQRGRPGRPAAGACLRCRALGGDGPRRPRLSAVAGDRGQRYRSFPMTPRTHSLLSGARDRVPQNRWRGRAGGQGRGRETGRHPGGGKRGGFERVGVRVRKELRGGERGAHATAGEITPTARPEHDLGWRPSPTTLHDRRAAARRTRTPPGRE